jgi:hypothetical protein
MIVNGTRRAPALTDLVVFDSDDGGFSTGMSSLCDYHVRVMLEKTEHIHTVSRHRRWRT